MTPPALQRTDQPKRRWLLAGLFTLCVGMVVVALFTIVGVRWIMPARRQRAAVEMVRALGGDVSWGNADQSWDIRIMRDWLPQDYPAEVRAVDLRNSTAGDMDMGRLSVLPELAVLFLMHTQVSDAGIAQFRGHRTLEMLHLEHTAVTDAGLAHLGGLPELSFLFLENTQVTDAGVVHLKGLQKLKWLDLTGTRVTDTGLLRLKGLTSLETLDLRGTQGTDAGVAKLQAALPNCKIYGP